MGSLPTSSPHSTSSPLSTRAKTKKMSPLADLQQSPASRVQDESEAIEALDTVHYQLPNFLQNPPMPDTGDAFRQSIKFRDPFMGHPSLMSSAMEGSNPSVSPDQKLSPHALDFTPATDAAQILIPDGCLEEDTDGEQTHVDINYLNATSVPETPFPGAGRGGAGMFNKNTMPLYAYPQNPHIQRMLRQTPLQPEHVVAGALMLENVAMEDMPIVEQFSGRYFSSVVGPLLIDFLVGGTVYIGYQNANELDFAAQKARTVRPEWSIRIIPSSHFNQKRVVVPPTASQVLAKACFQSPIDGMVRTATERVLPQLLGKFGDLMAHQAISSHDAHRVTMILTFREGSAGEAVQRAMNGYKYSLGPGFILVISWSRGGGSGGSSGGGVMGSPISQGDFSRSNSSGSSALEEQFAELSRLSSQDYAAFEPELRQGQWKNRKSFNCPEYANVYPSAQQARLPTGYPTGRRGMSEYPSPASSSEVLGGDDSTVRAFSAISTARTPPAQLGQPTRGNDFSREGAFPEEGRFNSFGGMQGVPRRPGRGSGRRDEFGHNGHNVVDVERIRRGTDVRTTIMLRNIPNKIDQSMLKSIIDETSAGKYDFMYLRIDFANNCNVGYAFINFEDPYSIIDFVQARAGFRWNRFNSDKVAEISYATIQGKDCLVQKFRNSSVMLEHPSFRPKIYHTGTGPMAGTEDRFPSPDNASKMRRSVENAEHVGLFAPRASQQNRDEQRRRRSQYDRGIRIGDMEMPADPETEFLFDPIQTNDFGAFGQSGSFGVQY